MAKMLKRYMQYNITIENLINRIYNNNGKIDDLTFCIMYADDEELNLIEYQLEYFTRLAFKEENYKFLAKLQSISLTDIIDKVQLLQ